MLPTSVRFIMIGFLTNVAPIMLGFVGKLFALKTQAAQEQQKMMIQKKIIILTIIHTAVVT